MRPDGCEDDGDVAIYSLVMSLPAEGGCAASFGSPKFCCVLVCMHMLLGAMLLSPEHKRLYKDSPGFLFCFLFFLVTVVVNLEIQKKLCYVFYYLFPHL